MDSLVILHDLVDDWRRGDVVSAAEMERLTRDADAARDRQDQDEQRAVLAQAERHRRILRNTKRLLDLGAVRVATPQEAEAGRAEVPSAPAGTPAHLAAAEEAARLRQEVEALRAQADPAELERLRRENDDLRRKAEEADRLAAQRESLHKLEDVQEGAAPEPPPLFSRDEPPKGKGKGK
jgi:hypothetical protein